MKLTLFTYDRPHWKTERFILELTSLGIEIAEIVAAPWKTLRVPPALVISVQHLPRHPRYLAERLSIPYRVQSHEGLSGEFGLIGGARIIEEGTVSRFESGILNLHPGLIPQNRGMSNVTRAIKLGLPQAVTAHLIDGRVDAGRVVLEQKVDTSGCSSVFDISEMLMDTQVTMLGEAIGLALSGAGKDVPVDCGGYSPPIPQEEELEIIKGVSL